MKGGAGAHIVIVYWFCNKKRFIDSQNQNDSLFLLTQTVVNQKPFYFQTRSLYNLLVLNKLFVYNHIPVLLDYYELRHLTQQLTFQKHNKNQLYNDQYHVVL